MAGLGSYQHLYLQLLRWFPLNGSKMNLIYICVFFCFFFYFWLTWSVLWKFPITCCPMSEIAFRPFGMGTFWPMSQHFIVLVTQFHTIFHTFFFYLGFLWKCLCSVWQSPGVTADISSERALLLVLIPFCPALHKTMVSIASTDYIHSSVWQTGWPGLFASLPAFLPGSQADLLISTDRPVLNTADSSSGSCANIIPVSWELGLDRDCPATS